MLTPAQEALAEGIGELASVHGPTWTFGDEAFPGVAAALRTDDPRMSGSSDRLQEIIVVTSELPLVRPKRGDELRRGNAIYRITRADHDAATGLSTFLVTCP